MARILKETGIGSGSLYWFFDSKEDLLIEVLEDWRAMISRCLEPVADHLPEGISTDTLAIFVLTVMEGGIMQARAHKDITYFDESVLHLKNYLESIFDTER